MGTRADFYVGRGASAEWIGSIGWDGYPSGWPEAVIGLKDEAAFREAVAKILRDEGGTRPEQGWPWPWPNSNTTDYTYAFDGGQVWGTCFGHGWWPADTGSDDDPTEPPKIPDSDWPNMEAIKRVAWDGRSGLLIS
jgi:hypothetical protein